MINIEAKHNILEANDYLAARLASAVESKRLEFAHDWGRTITRQIEDALGKVSKKFFKDMTHASRGVGRTSPLSNLPGMKPLPGTPWRPLSSKWKSRKVPANQDRFFQNTGKLKKQLNRLSWGDVFGHPEVEVDYKTRGRVIEVLKQGVTLEHNAAGRPRFRGKGGRFTTAAAAMEQEIVRVEYLEIEVDYTPLTSSYSSDHYNVMEGQIVDTVGDEKLAYKLGGPRGIVRPLVTPFAQWYIESKLPKAFREELKSLRGSRGLV